MIIKKLFCRNMESKDAALFRRPVGVSYGLRNWGTLFYTYNNFTVNVNLS